MNEKETMHETLSKTSEVIEIMPLGYGNPNASISYVLQKERGELRDDVEAEMVKIIESGRCIVDITEPDDGCIDGRAVMKVTYVDIEGTIREVQAQDDHEHQRPKVAGGGYMTSLAMEFAFHPPRDGVDMALRDVVIQLANHKIFCGAHSGDHENPVLGATDCGANDKVKTIFESGVTYKREIMESAKDLLAIADVTLDQSAQDQVVAGWAEVTHMTEAFEASTGRSRYETIMSVLREAQSTLSENKKKPLGVIKHLKGDHKEDFIIVNYQSGKTFSQALLRELIRERFPDIPEEEVPQAFIVDVHRIVELAQAISANKPQENAFAVALQAGVSYQLATAATLTDGSLRVFINK